MVHEVQRVFQTELASLHHRLRERPPNAAQYRGREDYEEAEEVKLCKSNYLLSVCPLVRLSILTIKPLDFVSQSGI